MSRKKHAAIPIMGEGQVVWVAERVLKAFMKSNISNVKTSVRLEEYTTRNDIEARQAAQQGLHYTPPKYTRPYVQVSYTNSAGRQGILRLEALQPCQIK
jgi:hypothetical protein